MKTPKSSVCCKVEHPCRIVKNIFGFQKAVYRGQRKNLNRLYVLFARANLYVLARAAPHALPGVFVPFDRAGIGKARNSSPNMARYWTFTITF